MIEHKIDNEKTLNILDAACDIQWYADWIDNTSVRRLIDAYATLIVRICKNVPVDNLLNEIEQEKRNLES